VALFGPSMGSRRKIPTTEVDRWAPLAARIADLEARLRTLEARLRVVTAVAEASAPKPRRPKASRAKPKPRCPGCMLELPQGRKGDHCVWCGFMFDAVDKRALR
jgi:hypothetical protein